MSDRRDRAAADAVREPPFSPSGAGMVPSLAAIVEQSPDVIVVHDGVTILYVNRAGIAGFGAGPDEDLVGRPVWEFVPRSERGILQERAATMLQDGRPAPAVELPFRLTDGSVLWGEVVSSPLRFDGQQAILTVIRDVTDRRRAEKALKKSQDRFERLFEGIPIGLFRSTVDGRILSANDALVRMLGYPDRSTLLSAPAEVLYPDPANRAHWMERALKEGVVSGHEMVLLRSDGEPRRVRIHCRVRCRDDGSVECLEGSLEDVTERRTTEEELRVSQQRLDRAVAASGLALWDWDIPTGEIFVDDRWFTMLGYEPGSIDLTYDHWFTLVHPDDREPAERALKEHLGGRTAFYECELRIRGRDGQWRWILDRGQVVERDGDGRPLRAAGTHMDIQRRVEADAALRRSEERLAGIIRAAPMGITVSRVRDGTIVEVNEAFCAAVCYSREELLGASALDVGLWVDPADRTRAREALQATGRLRGMPVQFRTRDDDIRVVQLYTELIDVDGVPCALTLHQDVTESRQLEEQLRQAQKMEAIGRLAGGIAHDFNNLLTAITGHVRFLLEETSPDDPRRGDAEVIEDSAQRARRLTRQLLAFSRQQVLNPRLVDLAEVIGSFEPLLSRIIGEDVALHVIQGGRPCTVRVDPSQLEQVVLNLIVNARDAMPEGGTLTIETGSVDLRDGSPPPGLSRPIPAGRYARLTVTDSGSGMDEATRARIFEPFFTTKPAGKGTGLGLSTVYGIVSQSDGHIGVESDPGTGTRFTLYLPCVDGPDAAPPAPTRDSRPRAARSGTVLLVEDEDAVRTLARRILERAGFDVHSAADGPEAIALAAEVGDIDLLLTDMVMPGMSGRELAERLRERVAGLPVLYMSGYTADEMIRDIDLRKGGFIEKPFTPEELADSVRRMLDGRTADREIGAVR